MYKCLTSGLAHLYLEVKISGNTIVHTIKLNNAELPRTKARRGTWKRQTSFYH